ncbi:MAG TPA: hypothetical protein VLA17_09875 [Candidatus Limnocylindria bacterium]|nr:hypothetical protein [Candidatus Limnocylindria bacterium]
MRSPLSVSERAIITGCVLVYIYLAVLAIGASWGGCHNPKGGNYSDNYSNQNDCAIDGAKLFLVDIIASIHNWREDVNAISTAVVAIFTVVLVYVTNQQARLTKISADAAMRSAATAEKALVDLEAPVITLKITGRMNFEKTIADKESLDENFSEETDSEKYGKGIFSLLGSSS